MTISHSFAKTLRCIGLAALVVTCISPTMAVQTHKAKLSKSQAEAIALKKYKGGTIQGKTELENESNKWEYAVIVKVGGKMHEVMVNSDTGKIDSEEVVTAKEEAAEKKAEAAAKLKGKHKSTKSTKVAAKGEKSEKGEKGEKD